jgi:PhnB protein
MAERPINDQLDDLVTEILAGERPDLSNADPLVAQLSEVATELRGLPSTFFYQELKEQLTRSSEMSSTVQKLDPMTVRRFSTYICVSNASAAIDFYIAAFGAKELMRLAEPSGKIGHAELQIGESNLKISDEYPEYGALSPQTLGGSPVKLHLQVENVDDFARRAVAAGAVIVRPIEDQFYGDRAGQLRDPFGYTWIVASHIRDVSVAEMQEQFDSFSKPKQVPTRREGYHSVTPYITVQKAPELVDFVKQAFGATEVFRTTGSAGGLHCEVRIGESMVMIGGGPGMSERPTAIHLYVPDVDDTFRRAIAAGATSLFEPADQPYGERSGAVEDAAGNRWYIATTVVPLSQIDKDLHTVTVYFHPPKAQELIDFLTNAFNAQEIMRSDSGDGAIYHAKVRIGDSVIEMGDARYEGQALPTAIYLYVDDVDATYEQALRAGGTSVMPPADQPYGDRNAWVQDPFENIWYIAATIS